jgi:hypothetical protein
MQPADSLSGIRLKLKRAWNQVDTLKAQIRAFLKDGPYRPSIHFDDQTSRLTIKAEIKRSPDPMWGIYVGEIVHNFRSALDHIVWELARRPSPRVAKTQFPIFEYQAGFTKRGTKEFLKGVSTAVVKMLETEQPFFTRPDGTVEGTINSSLWHLKELSDIDKHRTLHLTVSALASHQFDLPEVAHPFQMIDVQKHLGGPIEQDTVLWTGILKGARQWPFVDRKIKGVFESEITFEDGIPAPGLWSVIGTLSNCGNRAERIIRRIAEDILKTEL